MKMFEELGVRVERRWRQANYSEDVFSDIAADVLVTVECPPDFFREVTAWGLGDYALPFQFDAEAMFGQPPICVYVNPLQTFYVQALVWLDSTTSVHQHSFSGAFKVVEGQSVHARYCFEARDPVNSRIVFGDLQCRDAEVLSVGDVRKIERGAAFIHSVFHLTRPSVTLVVRTMGDTTKGPQYDYLRPGLAVDPFYKSPRLLRNLQILDALKEVDRARYVDALAELVPAADLYTAYRYMRHFYESAPRGEERVPLEALLRNAHRERGDRLIACLEQLARDGYLMEKRRQLHDRGHRFFVALLLNVPDRDTILRLIQSHYPGDPVEHVARWIGELCDGASAPLLPLGDAPLLALKHMVRGATLDLVVRAFREGQDDDVAPPPDVVAQLYQILRTSSPFKPLFLV